jgi:hypothetical protein
MTAPPLPARGFQNAKVTMNNVVRTSGEVVPLPANTTTTSFTVERASTSPPKQPVLVNYTVTNLCGEWKSFAGAGSTPGF